jgi:hypothetical protein
MFGAFVSRIKRKSLIIFLFLTLYCFCIHFYVTLCMKHDPGMHIGMHLVFFGKAGVTPIVLSGTELYSGSLKAHHQTKIGCCLCSISEADKIF